MSTPSWRTRASIQTLRIGAHGEIWAGTHLGLRRRSAAGEVRDLQVDATRPLANFVAALLFDDRGVLWVGTEIGLYRHDSVAGRFLHHGGDPAGAGGLHVSALAEDAEGTIWVGTFGAGLHRLERAGAGAILRPAGIALPQPTIWSVLAVPGALVLAGDGWLCTLAAGATRADCAHGMASPRRVGALAEAGSGERWLAEIGTLRRRTGQSWRRYPLPSEPGVFGSEELVQVLPEGRVVWVGGFGGALKRCDRTRERFTLIGRADRAGREQNGPVFDLLRGRDGALRLATGDGLSRYDEARGRFDHFGPAEGLPGSNVYSLLEDGHGRLWLGTNRGLARFVLRGEEPPAVRVYGPEERVGNVEFNRHARLRIAGDLHDELGSDLSGIALASSRLLSPRTLEPADQRRLSEIEEAPLRVMRGLRDIVWYVDPEHDTLESTAQRMRAVARELMPKVEIRFVEDFADAAAGIEMSARRQVFLVFKELVHNVARHRGCGLRAPLPTMRTSCRTRSRRRRSGVAGRGRESCPSRRR